MLVRSYSRHSRVIWWDEMAGDLRPEPAQLGKRRLFVRGVRVGVDEADRDRLHAFGLKVRDDLRQRASGPTGLHLLPVVVDAAGQLAAQAARHEGLGLLIVQVEKVRPVAARDLQRVAKPPAS